GWLTPSPPAAEATLADRRSFRMNAGQGRWCPPGAWRRARGGGWAGAASRATGAVPPRAGIATMGRGDASARALPAKTRGRPRGCPGAGAPAPAPALKRALGTLDLTLLGIGAIIGAGLFSSIKDMITGTAVLAGAGPAVVVSYALTALACGCAALCYAEIAAMMPVAGSAYSYSYAAFGERSA